MLRRHEIDVVAAPPLKLQHHAGNLFGRRSRDSTRFDRLANVVILAENAAQVAVRKEDRPRAVPSSQTIFFSEVWEVAADCRVAPRLAGGPFVLEPVDSAIARAGAAVCQR